MIASVEGLDEAIREVHAHGFGISLQIEHGGHFEFSIYGKKLGDRRLRACESVRGHLSHGSVPMRIIEALIQVEGTL